MDYNEKADKKINKTQSYIENPSLKLRSESIKRKSYNINEGVKSLDLALGRLKKSKLVNGECVTAPCSPIRQRAHMCMDISPYCPGIDNASMMSMNFSHYDLVRNLSNSICNSDGALSSNTSNARRVDLPDKDEHLERYFRSAEMWTKKYRDDEGPSNFHLNLPDK